MIRKPKKQVDAALKQKIKQRALKGMRYSDILKDLGLKRTFDEEFNLIHSYIHYCLSLSPKRKAERKENTKKRRRQRRQDKTRREAGLYVPDKPAKVLNTQMKSIRDNSR